MRRVETWAHVMRIARRIAVALRASAFAGGWRQPASSPTARSPARRSRICTSTSSRAPAGDGFGFHGRSRRSAPPSRDELDRQAEAIRPRSATGHRHARSPRRHRAALADGVAWVEATLGVPMQPGGRHPTMGTHNALLRLGRSAYLEVIAIDPDAPPPSRPRWYGLDDLAPDAPARLATWVVAGRRSRCGGRCQPRARR